MQSIVRQLDHAFRAAIHAAFGVEADPILGPAQNEKFGDYQSNAAMGLSKQVTEKTGTKTNPRQIAEQIKSNLNLGEIADKDGVTIAGPGFINVRLNPLWLASQLQTNASDPRLGIDKIEHPQTVVVDYSGPNIAKQMHVGHLRSTIIGDAISRVIEWQGNNVIRQNHIGDWGTQFGMLLSYGIRHNLFHSDALQNLEDLESFYRESKKEADENPIALREARDAVVELQKEDSSILVFWGMIVAASRRHYQKLYERLGVALAIDDERGESFYNPYLIDIVSKLKSAGLAVESDGATVVFIDGTKKSPLIIQKSDGGYLYGTTDLAAIKFRIDELHADRIIYTHDSRQAQHFHQVFETARRASWTSGEKVKLEYAPFGTMLGEDGKPFKTRSGDTIKLSALLDEGVKHATEVVKQKNPEMPQEQQNKIAEQVGIGAIKYADLSKDRISDYVFSWDKMLSFEGNTGPYLQYAYARIQSILRKPESKSLNDEIVLNAPHELALAKHVLRLGEIVEIVSRELKPHHLCTYLYDLASKFSGFYENCPVLQSEEPIRSSRLNLCRITAKTIAQGLELLGIEHPEQM